MHSKALEIGQFIPIHYHFQMLSDSDRMNSFKTAIDQVVKPGYKVAELGSGTGVMSYLAASKGAQVWSVEYNPELVSASRKFISENNMSDKVKIVHGDATNWLPPEPVDLVICEMLHSALLREKQIKVIEAFRKAHLQRFGTVPQFMPNATLLAVQPVNQGYDFYGYYAPVPCFQSAYHKAVDCMELGDPAVYKIIDYDNAHEENYKSKVSLVINQDAELNALRFITKSLMAIDYKTGKTVDWHNQHLVLPLPHTYSVSAGQTISLSFAYRPGDSIDVLQNSLNVKVINPAVTEKEFLIA
ncbi:MAG: methyltransferase domain-containing protein [Vallitaleaceae bacterium]|nr:methyltransferase domain-containing protein [Vallitaleaceae bacterium]